MAHLLRGVCGQNIQNHAVPLLIEGCPQQALPLHLLQERLEWAFQCVLTDPEYRFGNRLRGEELTPAPKRFIIEVYEKCTSSKLL
jgi:hypothetical protein